MIEIQHLSKTFETSDGTIEALKDINLSIHDGDIYGIIGMSGAGKSTLVRCINMLEKPTEGTVLIDGEDMSSLSESQLEKKRRNITMIFQSFNLLMQRNCLKNICFPLELEGIRPSEAKRRALELLEVVGLPEKAKAYPVQLSGGQQQRVAIARALATDPKVLLCDEATSALDPTTTHSILELIKKLHDELGLTVIIITHQMSVVEEICTNVAIIDDGKIVEEGEMGTVFSSPKSVAAKKLVYPDGFDELSEIPGIRKIRVVFKGAKATEKPLIATMAIEQNIAASILYASTRSIGEKAYGTMILGIKDDDETVIRALSYLGQMDDVEVGEA